MAYKALCDLENGKFVGIIDYAIPNKRIREFEWEGVTLYSEYEDISTPTWQDTFREVVIKFDLDTEFNKCNIKN